MSPDYQQIDSNSFAPPLDPSPPHLINAMPSNSPPTERTPLRATSSTHSRSYHRPSCQSASSHEPCEHGALSPHASRPTSQASHRPNAQTDDVPTTNGHSHNDGISSLAPTGNGARGTGYTPPGYGGRYGREQDARHGLLGDAVADGMLGSGDGDDIREGAGQAGKNGALSTTQYLARRHGVKGRRSMYLAYYFPFLNWIAQYRWGYLQGDLIAALTMASFYLPMSLSYAENLGHVPPINGLYSFVFNPFVYALLGSCPQMVVGPEAAGSLLVGSVVKSSVDSEGREGDELNSRIAGVVTGMAGAVIFIAGMTRLGFLDSVLSRPFLRGFISAIGVVILVDQLIPEMGLNTRATHVGGVSHGSSWEKLEFLFGNIGQAHGLTCGVAFGTFAIIMVCRYVEEVMREGERTR